MVRVQAFYEVMFLYLMAIAAGLVSAGKSWHEDTHHQLVHANTIGGAELKSRLVKLDVVCSEDHMTVNMKFDHPFYGLVYSQLNHHQKCVHVGPKAGLTDISFHIRYDSCGTVEVHKGQFHENTIVIQYGADVLEAWDEAKRLRCEWRDSFEKQSSKPTVAIAELDIVELNFQGDDVDCWMEVQEGKGPWARQVGGLVPIGSPLTLVIAINDHSKEFDMRVKECTAGDGSGISVKLTDENGCVVRTSLMTPFVKVKDFGGKATLVAYSHLHAFKFPDNLDVYVRCTVEVCRHGCPDSCKGTPTNTHPSPRDPHHNLALLKKQKLAELANSKSTDVYANHVSHHQSVKTFPPLSQGAYPLPGRHRNTETIVAASQKTVHHIFHSNSSSQFAKIKTQETPAFLPPHIPETKAKEYPHAHLPNSAVRHLFDQIKSHSQESRIKSHDNIQAIKASSNIDKHITSSLQSETQFQESHVSGIVNQVHVGGYHNLLKQNAHWTPEVVNSEPAIKSIVDVPKPEPSAWSADEVFPINRHAVTKHQKVKTYQYTKEDKTCCSDNLRTVSETKSFRPPVYYENKKIPIVPEPEPAPWTLDDVKPLPHPHTVVLQHEHVIQDPKPGPGPWTFDDVKPLPHPHHVVLQQEHIIDDPKPEPGPWTFENVKPLPHPHHAILQQEHVIDDPKPEPGPWTFDDVKPLQEEEVFGNIKELRHKSLNYKMKSHASLPIEIPVYKESVLPYVIPTPLSAPQPVYVPQYPTPNAYQNTSKMMNMMMMMMPTLVPHSYQTATWPQKSSARHLKPVRHHYPYPVPQFTSRQQLMQSVVADRRSDDDVSQLEYEDRPAITGFVPPALDEGISNDSLKPQPRQLNLDKENDKGPASELPSNTENQNDESETTTKYQDIELTSEAKNQDSSTIQNVKRVKRSSQPVFGVQHKFQAIALSDLAFDLNLTTDGTALFRGRREEIIYGVCISPARLGLSVGFILLLTLCSLVVSAVLFEHSIKLKSKTPHQSLLTRTFHGNLEPLYRFGIVRPNNPMIYAE